MQLKFLLVWCILLGNSARLLSAVSSPPNLYFSKIGKTTHVLDYVNLKLEIDIIGTRSLLEQLWRAMKRMHERMRPPAVPTHFIEYHRLKMVRVEELMDECDTYTALRDTVDGDAATRDKRFVFTLIAVLAAAAVTAFGVYTVSEITALNARTRSISEVASEVIDVQQEFGSSELNLEGHVQRTIRMSDDLAMTVRNLAYSTQTEHTVSAIERKMATVREIITAAMYQRLAPAAMQQKQFRYFLQTLQIESTKRGFQLLISRTSDLLQCSTSFVMTDVGINIITHVPSSPLEAILDMYRFVPLPIPVHDQYHATIGISDTILAIAPSEVIFRTMSAFDLSQCTRLGDYFVCHEGNVMRKALPAMQTAGTDSGVCMYALFTQNFEVANKACDVYISPASSSVHQISTHTFVTFSDRPFTGSLQCLDSTSNLSSISFRPNQIQSVTLPPGCILDSERHVFSSGDRARTRAWSINISVPHDQLSLTGDINFTSFHQFRLHSDFSLHNQSSYHLPVALQHWKQWLHSQESVSPLDALTAATPWATVVMIVIAVSQILVVLYVRHALSRLQPQGGHPNPPPGPVPNISVMTVNHAAEMPAPSVPLYPSAPSPTDMSLSRFIFPSLRK